VGRRCQLVRQACEAASRRRPARLVAACTATKAPCSNACCGLYCEEDPHSNLLTTALPLLYYCFTTALLLLYYCFTTALLLLYYCFTTMQVSELLRQASDPHSLLRNSTHAHRIRKARVVFAGTLTGLANRLRVP
jgi:ABC-type uncharacterized transport system permease subunit